MGPSRPPPPLPAAASAAAIEVILLRLSFPTYLIRAVVVSKCWLHHASDPTFLRRFIDLNPPRLLGFYLTSLSHHQRRLADVIPMLPQPPKLTSITTPETICAGTLIFDRRGCFNLNGYEGPTLRTVDCRNGRVFISLYHPAEYKFTRGVHTPLHCQGSESGYGLSYFWFTMEFIMNNRGSHVYVYKLQDNVWHMLFSARTQLNCFAPRSPNNLIVEDKFYVAATRTSILVLDLTSSSYPTIDLLDGVLNKGNTVLSRANDSGVYLVHLKELQRSIWLLRGTNGSMGDRSLVDTIFLRDMCANLGAVGDNAEFAFLDMGQCILYLDVRSRALRNVYEKNEYYDSDGCWIRPYMMSWPPIFPVLKE
uniref:F-box protein AT5G49610-like beta-propeller domain-containing protein n=1 Tax=Setaria italica TaxID=4555 RepID=K3Z056_SETIT